MISETGQEGTHPLRAIAEGWVKKVRLAEKHREPWKAVADECTMFFSADTGFLWDSKNASKFFNSESGPVNPKFKITIAKAFEMVALFGPTLYWRNPQRAAEPREWVNIPPELFGDPQDPQAQQRMQEVGQLYSKEKMTRQLRADLMMKWLNYCPNKLDLHNHAEMAITDALITGRGLLWSEPYQIPGTGDLLVGSFRVNPDDFGVDPDAHSVEDAWWIYRKTLMPVWKAEQKWKQPPGSLKRSGQFQSVESQGETSTREDRNSQQFKGESQDLVEVIEIWSRCGPGTRLTGVNTMLKDHLEQTCGDYCYIACVDGVPYPLNFSTQDLWTKTSDEVKKAFRWPTAHWTRGKWPVSVLDFYRKRDYPYPIPPLAPGLGELKFLNVMLSHLCSRIWSSSRDFIAVAQTATEEIEKAIKKGEDLCMIPLEATQDDIRKVVQFLQQPQVNFDVWRIMDAVMEMFDRRVGLSELLYGTGGGPASRSATDVKVRERMVSIRPEHMAEKVGEWMTEVAESEAVVTRFHVDPEDVAPLLGPVGVQLWKQFIAESPVQATLMEIDYRIEANSGRKPNKERDTENLQQLSPIVIPLLQSYGEGTGDTEPLNKWLALTGKIMEFKDMPYLPPIQKQEGPSPEEQQAQQQAQQEAQMEQQKAQTELQMAQAKFQQELAAAQAKAAQEAQAAQEKLRLDNEAATTRFNMDFRQQQVDLSQDQEVHAQEMVQKGKEHILDMLMNRETHSQKLKQGEEMAQVKARMAARPPTTNGSAK